MQIALKKWLQVMKRKVVPSTKFSRVCSEHFVESDYVKKGCFGPDGCFTMIKTTHLTDTACPSQFDFSQYDLSNTDCPSTSSAVSSHTSERALRRKRRNASQV